MRTGKSHSIRITLEWLHRVAGAPRYPGKLAAQPRHGPPGPTLVAERRPDGTVEGRPRHQRPRLVTACNGTLNTTGKPMPSPAASFEAFGKSSLPNRLQGLHAAAD